MNDGQIYKALKHINGCISTERIPVLDQGVFQTINQSVDLILRRSRHLNQIAGPHPEGLIQINDATLQRCYTQHRFPTSNAQGVLSIRAPSFFSRHMPGGRDALMALRRRASGRRSRQQPAGAEDRAARVSGLGRCGAFPSHAAGFMIADDGS